MTSINITKTSAAKRQIDAAIRIMFSGEDALAAHTIAAAAHRIVQDLAKKRRETGGTWRLEEEAREFLHRYRANIPRELQGDSWLLRSFFDGLYRPANFLKHADRDHGSSLDEADLNTDTLLLFSCVTYTDLGLPCTTEMRAYCRWHLAIYPHEKGDVIRTGAGNAHELPRHHQLEFGKRLLELYQSRPSRP